MQNVQYPNKPRTSLVQNYPSASNDLVGALGFVWSGDSAVLQHATSGVCYSLMVNSRKFILYMHTRITTRRLLWTRANFASTGLVLLILIELELLLLASQMSIRAVKC